MDRIKYVSRQILFIRSRGCFDDSLEPTVSNRSRGCLVIRALIHNLNFLTISLPHSPTAYSHTSLSSPPSSRKRKNVTSPGKRSEKKGQWILSSRPRKLSLFQLFEAFHSPATCPSFSRLISLESPNDEYETYFNFLRLITRAIFPPSF